MKQDNSQNITSNDIAIPGQVEAILKLLWTDEKMLQVEASNVSTGIEGVLKIYETAKNNGIANLKFSNQKDVKKAMDIIALDSTAFDKLDKWFRDNLDVWKQTLRAYLEEWKSFLDVQNFIASNFSKKKQPALSEFYRDHISMTSEIFLTSIEKQLLNLDKKNPKLFKNISSRLLEQKKNKLTLNSSFVTLFKNTIAKKTDYADLSEEDRDTFDISIFQNHLWLSKSDMTPDMLMLILSLRELIHIKKAEVEIAEENLAWGEDEDTLDSLSENDDDTDSYRSYTPLFSSEWTIDMGVGESIKLSPEEMKMNDTALENYVTAVKICRDIGLGFIFKHKHQFLSVICSIDYLSWEWITESKLLRILNRVGKQVWIPEKNLSDQNDKDAAPKIWCFKTFWEAKKQFRDIKDTGVVGWVSYDPMKSDRSVAERALIQKWFFDLEWKWFLNIENW